MHITRNVTVQYFAIVELLQEVETVYSWRTFVKQHTKAKEELTVTL